MTRRANKSIRSVVLGVIASALVVGQSLGAVAASTSSASAVSHSSQGSGGSTYLALGDSLATGFQPGRGETANGYVNQLWRGLRVIDPDLRLRNFGCSGETSRGLITGQNSPCRYDAGSQLNAAVAYLDEHPGQVRLITLNVGSNDLVNRCDRRGLIEKACVVDLRPRLKSRLKQIVTALSTAAGSGVPIIAMTYYNPFLGLWGLVPGGRALARADQRSWTVFNAALGAAYERAGARVADVAQTFRIADFKHTMFVPGRGRLPVNVALTCKWTWVCSKFDVHPNRTGYGKIARTFQSRLSM